MQAEFQVQGNSADEIRRAAESLAREFFGDIPFVIESIECEVNAQTYGGLVIDWLADVVAKEVEG